MSGICGAVCRDVSMVRVDDLRPVLEELRPRGPDGSSAWSDSRAAFGHASLISTPEARNEAMPCVDPESGYVITADARLDNREDLLEALGRGSWPSGIGDGELILHCYLRWGEHCLEKLRGDFAFAIWNPREECLFCARDQVGMRQLIYTYQEERRFFAFATDAHALAAHPQVRREINELRILDFLEDLEAADLTSTFFRDLFRLPPAHCLKFEGGRLQVQRYWRPQASEPLKFSTHAEAEEAFLDIFGKAVKARLRSDRPVGSMLSGGIDSSSVVAVAADLLTQSGAAPLQTFSAVRSGSTPCLETSTILTATKCLRIEPTLLDLSDLGSMRQELLTSCKEVSDPFDGHMNMIRAIYLSAHNSGVNVVLDGVCGDTTLSHDDPLPELVRARRWRAAYHEARGQNAYWKVGRHPFARIAWESIRQVAPEGLKAANRSRLETKKLKSTLVAPTFVEEQNLAARLRANVAHLEGYDEMLPKEWSGALHPHIVVGRERYDRVAAQFGVEPRDPFADLRVMEFCARIANYLMSQSGWPKYLLRKSVSHLLPPAIVWRRGKEHLGWAFTQAMVSSPDISGQTTGLSTLQLGKYVRSGFLNQLELPIVNPTDSRMRVWYLSNWILRNSAGP